MKAIAPKMGDDLGHNRQVCARVWKRPAQYRVRGKGQGDYVQVPSGKAFFLDAETVGFLFGNEEFFLLARKYTIMRRRILIR
ncbi:MAG: hypothetical protein ACOCV7_01885 [Desulfonatronovibrionaceae bacterium]